ncbi:MAG: Ig-like domain-containing protein, partial [Nanoarchaeota archaeon]
DRTNKQNNTETRNITVDTIVPGVNVTFPVNGTVYSSADLPLVFNITLNENGGFAQYSLDNGTNNVTMTTKDNRIYNASNGSIADGMYTIRFYVNDTTGNRNYSEFKVFTMDTAPPNFTILSPENKTYITNNVSINFSATDTNGISMRWFANDTANTTYSAITSQIVSEGNHVWRFYANDTEGNLNYTNVTFFVDTLVPGVRIDLPAGNLTTNRVEFNVTLSETGGTVLLTLTNGTMNYTMTRFNNTYFNYTNASIADGTYTAKVYANDTAGNRNDTETKVFTIDTTLPSVSSLTEYPADPATYSSSQIYEFNATVTDTSLAIVRLQFNNVNYTATNLYGSVYNVTLTSLPAGVHSYRWIANDSINNINATEIGTYTVNNATGNVELALNGSYANQTAVYGTQTNATANTSYGTIVLYRDGGVFTANNGLLVTLGAGDYNYTAVSLGNQNYSSTAVTRWVHITQASSIVNLSLNSSEGNITINNATAILLNGTRIVGENGGRLLLYNNGTLINDNILEASNNTNFTKIGVYNVSVIYIGSQNYSQSSETYYVNVSVIVGTDTTSPGITINVPTNITYNSSAGITFNITLNENGSLVQYSLDGGAVNVTMTTEGNRNYTHTNSSIVNGSYTFRVYANDTSDNWNRTESVVFSVVDTNKPSILLSNPGNAVDYSATSQSVTFQYTVVERNIANCSLLVDGSVANNSLDAGYSVDVAEGVNEFKNTFSSSGSARTWRVECMDKDKNTNSSSNRTFTVTAPSSGSGSGSSGGSSGGSSAGSASSSSAGEGSGRIIKLIEAIPEELSISTIMDVPTTRELVIRNNREEGYALSVSVEGIGNILSTEKVLSLGPGESKAIELKVKPVREGLLTGKIVLKSSTVKLEVPVVINVRSNDFLFDTAVKINNEERVIDVGENLKAQIDLKQVGPEEKVDVYLTYVIKDFAGNVHLEDSETFFVLGEKNFVKEFSTKGLEPGKYIIGIELSYPGAFATSSAQFEVGGEGLFGLPRYVQLIIVIATLAVASAGAIIWSSFRKRKIFGKR